MTFEENKAKGRAAFLAGEPFDIDEGPGWQIGYGDAITIEPATFCDCGEFATCADRGGRSPDSPCPFSRDPGQ